MQSKYFFKDSTQTDIDKIDLTEASKKFHQKNNGLLLRRYFKP